MCRFYDYIASHQQRQMKYTLYTLLLLVASLISKAQTTAVSIKWKIAPNDTVIYSMAMNSIEIAKSDSSSIATSPAGAGDDSVFFSKMLSKLAKSLTTDYNYTSRMYLNTKGSINVELVTKLKRETQKQRLQKIR